MRKIIVAVCIISLILGFGIAEQFFIHSTFNTMCDRMDTISELIRVEDYPTAIAEAEDVRSWWRNRRNILELTSPHNEVKDMVNYLSQLIGYLECEQQEDALTTTYIIHEDAMNKLNILAYRVKNVL